jgi:hypothetical protein
LELEQAAEAAYVASGLWDAAAKFKEGDGVSITVSPAPYFEQSGQGSD